MGRPPKPFTVITTEKKSHRTKAELETRKQGEKALLTGIKLREWPEVKDGPLAHKEFSRIRKLLGKIGHDDALYEPVINRYCLLISECQEFEVMLTDLQADIKELREMKAAQEIDPLVYLEHRGNLQDRIMTCDKKIMEKRKMLLSIEKENVMTILGALRAVPKTPDKAEEKSKMASFLERRQAR
jgi:tRNA/tmRNA/rRNA uracil-C5-methylase (TrmA/RlmC/RlmD family)